MNITMKIKFTKELVDKCLKANIRNRKVSSEHIKYLARQMMEGKFYPNNGQTIVINRSMTWILDGQHRLLAIKAAGYPVYEFMVVFVDDDIAEKTMMTIDTGRNRRMADIVSIKGIINNSAHVCAIYRLVSKNSIGEQRISAEEFEDAYTKTKGILESLKVCTRFSPTGSKMPVAFWAAALNASIVLGDSSRVSSITERVCHNECKTPVEKAILSSVLKYNQHKLTIEELYWKCSKGFIREDITNLSITKGEDMTPYKAKNWN